MSTEAAPTLSITAIQARRTKELERAFMRILAKKPTTLEKAAIKRAALLATRAEAATLDSAVPVEHVVSLVNLSRRAEASLFDLIGHPKRRAEAVPCYDDSPGEAIAALMREAEGHD